MSAERRVGLAALEDFSTAVLEAAGCAPEQARSAAEVLVFADAIGRQTHGVWRLPDYARRCQVGLINGQAEPRFEQTGPATGLLHGDNGFGLALARRGMDEAIALARAAGVGAVGVHQSNHCGVASYFVKQAADAGLLGLAFSNSVAKVAPVGGARGVFGTNPFAFGAPDGAGQAILVDFATAAVAGSIVKQHAEDGRLLPEGLAIDADGNPLTDAARIAEGALLPFGGAKGYGLQLMIEILVAVITGAGMSSQVKSMFDNWEEPGDNGQFLLALDPARFLPAEQYDSRLGWLVEQLRAAAPATGMVLLPGEKRAQLLAQASQHGVVVNERSWAALARCADSHRVALPADEGTG